MDNWQEKHTTAEPSVETVNLIESHLQDVGVSMSWRLVDNPDLAINIYKTIKAYIQPEMVPFYVIESHTKGLARIVVFSRAKKKLIDLHFDTSPLKYV